MRPPVSLSILRDLVFLGKPRGAVFTPLARQRHGRHALFVFLAMLVGMSGPAYAQRPGRGGEDGPAPLPKRAYAGPQYPGKPPPLDGTDTPPAGMPRGSAALDGPGEMPPSGARPTASGTGFLVVDGRILTNNHVIADCGRLVARTTNGARAPVRVLATDRRRDLALLGVTPGFGPPLTFREAPPVRRGEVVVTYGFPYANVTSSGPTLTTGDLSALSGLRDNQTNFQITAPVNPGNSGGPLLDSQGNVIGVIVSKLNALRMAEMTGGDIPQNVNFAIKGLEALAFLRANNVSPRTTSATIADRRNTEIGEIADPSTVALLCYR